MMHSVLKLSPIYRSIIRSALDERNPNLRPPDPISPNLDRNDDNSPRDRNQEVAEQLGSSLFESQSKIQAVPNNRTANAHGMSETPLLLKSSGELNDTEVPIASTYFFTPDDFIGKSFLVVDEYEVFKDKSKYVGKTNYQLDTDDKFKYCVRLEERF